MENFAVRPKETCFCVAVSLPPPRAYAFAQHAQPSALEKARADLRPSLDPTDSERRL